MSYRSAVISTCLALLLAFPVLTVAEMWYVSEDDGNTCRKMEATKRPYPLGRNPSFEDLLKQTASDSREKPASWSISQKELELHQRIRAELDRLLVTSPDQDEPLPVVAARMKLEPSYVERIFILGDVVEKCIREGRVASGSPTQQPVKRETKSLYRVLDASEEDTPIKTQVELRLLVAHDITGSELDSVLRQVWQEQQSRSGFSYHAHPTMIGIFAYLTEAEFRRGSAWVGRVIWRESGSPQITNLRK